MGSKEKNNIILSTGERWGARRQGKRKRKKILNIFKLIKLMYFNIPKGKKKKKATVKGEKEPIKKRMAR